MTRQGTPAAELAAPERGGVGARPSRFIDVAAVIGFLGLCALLIPFGVFFIVQVWQLLLAAVVGVVIATVVRRVTSRPAGVHVVGVVAVIVGWVCAFVLAGWDNEGRLSDHDAPLLEIVVGWTAAIGNVLAFVLGLVAAIRSVGWGGRYGGLATPLAGAFMVTGLAFL